MKPERHHSEPHKLRSRPARLTEVRSPKVTEGTPIEVAEGQSPEAVEEPMKCVWSGYPAYERDCRSRIPASVVLKAWQREMQLKGTREGFFYFPWRSGVWLAFGAQDGGVRGVYCPTHCSERESRGVEVEDRRADQPKGIALQ